MPRTVEGYVAAQPDARFGKGSHGQPEPQTLLAHDQQQPRALCAQELRPKGRGGPELRSLWIKLHHEAEGEDQLSSI